MSRTLIAVVLFALALGAVAWATPAARAAEEVADRTFSLNMQAAPVAEVVQYVATASGASVTVDGDVTGTITLVLSNATVKEVLDRICQAKGYSWCRDESGGYIVSAQSRRSEAQAVPGLAHKGGEVTRMQKVQFMNAQFLVYQLGLSDDPGPEEGMRDPFYREALMSLSRGSGELRGMGGGGPAGGGGGGFGGGGAPGGGRGRGAQASAGRGAVPSAGRGGNAGGGDLGTFLPEGVSEIVAYPMLNSLLIRGTEEGIDGFIEFLKLIDRKPQQIFIEIQSVVVASNVLKEFGFQWFYNVGNLTVQPSSAFKSAASITVGYTPAGVTNFQATLTYLLTTSQGKVTDAIRVATMNLMTASNQVTTQYPVVTTTSSVSGGITPVTSTSVNLTFLPITTSISITPRINGDGTITMTIPYSKSDIVDYVEVPTGVNSTSSQKIPIQSQTNIATTLNVRDGETMVIGGAVLNRDLGTNMRMPILGDLPLIGNLFNKRTRTLSESETLIFITPRIIRDEAAPSTLPGI